MAGRKLLLMALCAAFMASGAPALAASSAMTCTREQVLLGECVGAGPIAVTPINSDGAIGLGGSIEVPGRAGGRPGSPEVIDEGTPRAPICDPTGRICRDRFTVTGPLEGRGPITLSDLVSFRPVVEVHRVQPDGWSVVGLHTNFYTETVVQVQDDLLLGIPASVRFTPVSYRWDYGDGESARAQTGGRSWNDLGLAEFDRTPTSHVYTQPGTFDITLVVDFGAEYRFGGTAWIPIAGTVSVPANSLTVSASDAKTVLVGSECSARPSPGC